MIGLGSDKNVAFEILVVNLRDGKTSLDAMLHVRVAILSEQKS